MRWNAGGPTKEELECLHLLGVVILVGRDLGELTAPPSAGSAIRRLSVASSTTWTIGFAPLSRPGADGTPAVATSPDEL